MKVLGTGSKLLSCTFNVLVEGEKQAEIYFVKVSGFRESATFERIVCAIYADEVMLKLITQKSFKAMALDSDDMRRFAEKACREYCEQRGVF